MKPVLTLQQVLDKNGVSAIRNFSLVNFKGNTFYQVIDKDSVYKYYSATDGVILKDGDRQYATYLARYFTQDSTSNIKKIDLQTTFDGQYQPINHLLPVWKVSFDRPDGMDVYGYVLLVNKRFGDLWFPLEKVQNHTAKPQSKRH